MKRRIIASLVITMMLVATMAMPVMAEEERPFGASVTINEFINFTVTDWTPGAGLDFGDLNPATANASEIAQTALHGAVTLTVGADTNVSCNITVKGDDFAGPGPSIPIGAAVWNTANVTAGGIHMKLTEVPITASTAGVQKVQQLWHWLSIPPSQTAGDYFSVFTYKAAQL